MISSVPYVTPDPMKNVAATSGQSVSLATLFFTLGITREGSWVGTDIELNFYSRPPKGKLALAAAVKRVRIRRIQESPPHARKKCTQAEFFSVCPTFLPHHTTCKVNSSHTTITP